jgi:hypothetical protein
MHTSVTVVTLHCDRCKEETKSLRDVLYRRTPEEIEEAQGKRLAMMPRLPISYEDKQPITLSELCPKCWTELTKFLKPSVA